jgi:hypothetical protein
VSDPRLAAIRDRIRLLASLDPSRQIFGAVTHQHQLAPPLTEGQLVELESRFGKLPDEYRRFVGTVAAHGAGPYYGLVAPSVPEDTDGPGPDPRREFRCDTESPFDTKLPEGTHLLDGTLYISEQGCGGRSVLVVRGPSAGEVWSDWTREQGTIAREAPSFLVWYEQWIERALLDWIERVAAHIAIDGPSETAQLEGIALAFELVERAASGNPKYLRTLGYLHMREQRWTDADAAFKAASKAGGDEPEARLALDRARLAVVRGSPDVAIVAVHRGLSCEGLWYSTRDELRETLERAFAATGRADEALEILDERAAERFFSLDLHHRLARERLARNDLENAGLVLERAARMGNIMGRPQPIEERVPASFDPIIAELRAAGRHVDAEALVAQKSLILDAN